VVIRARDQASRLPRLLNALDAQTLSTEHRQVIVVDGGSQDDTVARARAAGAEVVELSAAQWSYGAAINRGAEVSRAPILALISAHALPPDSAWLERLARWLEDPRVCAVSGDSHGPGNLPLPGPWRQNLAAMRRDPFWGFSATGGGLRRELWEQRRFREDLPMTEDREWARYWLQQGYEVVIDPGLLVATDYGRRGPVRHYRRARSEYAGYAMFSDLPPYGPGDLLREWWSGRGYHRSQLRARVDPRRAGRLLGAYRGRRSVSPTPSTARDRSPTGH
jgi:glycosyltransferase involved in cell wall biosynthesis